ncbi:simple sugar transport system permease protein [Actinopolymorpha cephalotaxi]|uniref:Simple sugar transport system permease protein n=1 Tax=Actinopolymorpha cephalotaxi TaxID=504797 RepID=A0A1I2KTR6_9ACTN|nr:ABC transporter permease [Actinopolymorpha cephalotaxi]NYH84628.1 simple sugar transport system permease protein [Actinopolymorpha cephalotaxi]SFF69650.1 simple sugar transport system permease protein [Actinopolymorpha cephalotaxi]
MTTTLTRPQANAAIESPEERRRRIRTGILALVLAALGVLLAVFTAPKTAKFGLSDQFAAAQLPDISLPALPVALALAAYALVLALTQLFRGVRGRWARLLWVGFALALVVTFLCWAAAGKTFPLTNQLQGTLNLATPLILGALAGVLCERAGVINVAIEGQFLSGAFAAAVVTSATGSFWAGAFAAILAGVLIAAMLAVFAIRYRVNQVVLGVVLVVFASGITGFLFDQFVKSDSQRYNNPGVLPNVPIPVLSAIPVIGQTFFAQTLLVYAMYVAVAVVTVVLFKTRWGLRVRSVGEHPRAADTVGINVLRVRYQAVLAGGIVAGLGGAFFTIGFTGSFDKDLTAGQGFIALAALIMGRWNPLGATVAALFFGFTQQLQGQLQILQTPIPGELLVMAPYLATVVAVAGAVGRVRPPKADGEPYEKG